MMRSLWTAASGMKAQQTNVDVISNNIANVNTVGYKAQMTQFKSLLYQTIATETTSANGDTRPTSAQVGLGTRVASIDSRYSQGSMTATERDTDFCIDGNGFFAVRNGEETLYTRAGSFVWALNGGGALQLSTPQGHPVLDSNNAPIILPAGVASGSVIVSGDGAIGYKNAEGETVMTGQQIGLFQFSNPTGLENMSNSLLRATAASGQPINEATANGVVRSEVIQGYLEQSNVSVADEMVNLIVAQRAYELNSKAITTSDTMLETANNLKR